MSRVLLVEAPNQIECRLGQVLRLLGHRRCRPSAFLSELWRHVAEGSDDWRRKVIIVFPVGVAHHSRSAEPLLFLLFQALGFFFALGAICLMIVKELLLQVDVSPIVTAVVDWQASCLTFHLGLTLGQVPLIASRRHAMGLVKSAGDLLVVVASHSE